MLNWVARTKFPKMLSMMSGLKVVGLCLSDNDRSCTRHTACGLSINVGDIVKFKRGFSVDPKNPSDVYDAIYVKSQVRRPFF